MPITWSGIISCNVVFFKFKFQFHFKTRELKSLIKPHVVNSTFSIEIKNGLTNNKNKDFITN